MKKAGERYSCLFHEMFILFNLKAFETTLNELNAIAAPATHGASNPAAAIGMPALL